MGTDKEKLQRLESQLIVMEQLIKDSYKMLLKSVKPPTGEEETKDQRIKNLEGVNYGYHHKVKCQEKEIEELKDEITAQNAAFQLLLKKT